MPHIEQRGKTSWRITQVYKGIRFHVTIESAKKPSYKAAQMAIDEVITEAKKNGSLNEKRLTVKNAAEKYISAKENSLSPSTLRGYKSYTRNLPDDIANKLIPEVTEEDLQNLVKSYQEKHSVKYTRNVIEFLKSVFKMFGKRTELNISFKAEAKKEPYIPTPEEVKKIIAAASGTEFEIPVALAACCGLRRGEILALSVEDLEDNNILHIKKAVVIDDNGEIIIKNTPKTPGSVRDIVVPGWLADKIRKKGYIYQGNPGSILNWLTRTQEKLNIQKFTFHKLRHYFCSYLHDAGIPDATIMKLGGWSDPGVMQRIYRHGKNDYETMLNAANIISDGIK